LERELRYEISRRIQRGSELAASGSYRGPQDRAAAVAAVRALRSNAIFHSEQGWGSYLDLGIGGGNIRFTPIVAIDNADDLVEEPGYGLRFEARRLALAARRQPRVVLVRSGLA
jgi:hypothetical protein